VINADIIDAELADPLPLPGPATSVQPNGGPETLSSAVERHIKEFLAAHNDGLGVTDVYDKIIAEVERPLIRLTLAATRGNQIKAASMLGLNRNTLRKKIRDLEIPVVRGLM
jgi:two-component system nitrogen regulation response regulator GlnG